VEFSRELRADVLSGEITVSFRLWQRPKVKPGGRYRVGVGQIEVDSVELVPFSTIDDIDVRGLAKQILNLFDGGRHMQVPSTMRHSSTESSFTLLGRLELSS
jgi:hypothetical protein